MSRNHFILAAFACALLAGCQRAWKPVDSGADPIAKASATDKAESTIANTAWCRFVPTEGMKSARVYRYHFIKDKSRNTFTSDIALPDGPLVSNGFSIFQERTALREEDHSWAIEGDVAKTGSLKVKLEAFEKTGEWGLYTNFNFDKPRDPDFQLRFLSTNKAMESVVYPCSAIDAAMAYSPAKNSILEMTLRQSLAPELRTYQFSNFLSPAMLYWPSEEVPLQTSDLLKSQWCQPYEEQYAWGGGSISIQTLRFDDAKLEEREARLTWVGRNSKPLQEVKLGIDRQRYLWNVTDGKLNIEDRGGNKSEAKVIRTKNGTKFLVFLSAAGEAVRSSFYVNCQDYQVAGSYLFGMAEWRPIDPSDPFMVTNNR